MTAVAGVIELTTIDGETRTAGRYEDGGWNCPWCSAACVPGADWYERRGWDAACANPACIVGGCATPEGVAAARAAWASAEARQREARAIARANTERHQQAQAEAAQQYAQAVAESADEGWCLACWSASTWRGQVVSRARKVRHRDPGNCPQARRGL